MYVDGKSLNTSLMAIDKREFPYEVIEKFTNLKSYCRDLQRKHALILSVKIDELYIHIQDITSNGKFYYIIEKPYLDQTHKVMAEIRNKPKNRLEIKERKITVDLEKITASIEGWLELVQQYDRISLNEDDQFLNFYQEKYIEEFKILDPDADSIPFNDEQQRLLTYALEAYAEVIDSIDVPAEQKEDILKDIKKLKDKIPTFTKNQVISRLSNLWAKIKLKGLDFKETVMKEAPKVFAKILIEKGIHIVANELPKLFQQFL